MTAGSRVSPGAPCHGRPCGRTPPPWGAQSPRGRAEADVRGGDAAEDAAHLRGRKSQPGPRRRLRGRRRRTPCGAAEAPSRPSARRRRRGPLPPGRRDSAGLQAPEGRGSAELRQRPPRRPSREGHRGRHRGFPPFPASEELLTRRGQRRPPPPGTAGSGRAGLPSPRRAAPGPNASRGAGTGGGPARGHGLRPGGACGRGAEQRLCRSCFALPAVRGRRAELPRVGARGRGPSKRAKGPRTSPG